MKVQRMMAACLVLGAACVHDTGPDATPNTPVLLTDSPFPYDEIARVDMYITRIEVTGSPDSGAGALWITVAEPLQTINLLDLQSGATMLLGTMPLNAYEVSQVRVVVNTSLSSVSRADGSLFPVNWGGSGEMTIHAVVEASLGLYPPSVQHRLVIDFDVGRSFVKQDGPPLLHFIPWIRALDDAGSSVVTGVVSADADGDGQYAPLPHAAVTVLHGNPNLAAHSWYKVATGRTDAEGRYRVAFILPGEYVVRIEPVGVPAVGCLDSLGVIIGSDTTVDVRLPPPPGLCAQETSGGGGLDSTGTPTGGPVESVTLRIGTPSGTTSVQTCDSVPLDAELRDASGQLLVGRRIDWTVSVPIALELGRKWGAHVLLRAVRPGSATVTATSEARSASVTFTVSGPACGTSPAGSGPVAKVTIHPVTVLAWPGDSVGLYAGLVNAQDQPLYDRAVSWSSSDTTVVGFRGLFGQSALLHLKRPGTATIEAMSETKVGTATVVVR